MNLFTLGTYLGKIVKQPLASVYCIKMKLVGSKAGFPLVIFSVQIDIFHLFASLITSYHISKSSANKEKKSLCMKKS